MNKQSLIEFGVAGVIMVLALGCSVHRESSISTAKSGQGAPAAEFSPSTQEIERPTLNCDAAGIKCRDEYSPVHCKTVEKGLVDQRSSTGDRHVWAPNECLARQKLSIEICKDEVNVVNVESILCTPDPAEGSCPPEPTFCTREFDPTTCRLVKYDNKEIGELKLIASGSNRCEARGALGLAACKNNFNPNKLTEVDCIKSNP